MNDDTPASYGDEPLEPWETGETRKTSRDGWRGDDSIKSRLSLLAPDPKPAHRGLDLQELVNFAVQQVQQMLAIRQATVRDFDALRQTIQSLRAERAFRSLDTFVPPSWLASLSLEVVEISNKCSNNDWDGMQGEAIDRCTVEHVLRFAALLPSATPRPDIGVDPDGEVTLEWQYGASQVVTISIAPNGKLSFAGLFLTGRTYGTEILSSNLPQTIAATLGRLFAEAGEHSA